MKTITIVGWAAQQRSVVESVTYWPDEMDVHLAIAKAASGTNLMMIEQVLVEEVLDVQGKTDTDLDSGTVVSAGDEGDE